MVNFRFHIVSLVAVFLALGLGVLMGSAVVNGPVVDRLDREIDIVRGESQALRAANDELRDELDRANAFIADSAAFAVDGRLADVPVAILAERDVDGDIVDQTATLVREAGGETPAVFWLEEAWSLSTDEEVQSLRDATGLLGSATSLRSRALDELADRLTEPLPAPLDGEEPAEDLLVSLSDAGFLGIEGDDVDLAAFPSQTGRALLITGTDSTFAGTSMTLEAVTAFVDADAPSVLGEIFVPSDEENSPARAASVAPVRTDETLTASVATVDNLELVQGRVAAVLALEGLGAGAVGHFGYGDGASASMPPAADS